MQFSFKSSLYRALHSSAHKVATIVVRTWKKSLCYPWKTSGDRIDISMLVFDNLFESICNVFRFTYIWQFFIKVRPYISVIRWLSMLLITFSSFPSLYSTALHSLLLCTPCFSFNDWFHILWYLDCSFHCNLNVPLSVLFLLISSASPCLVMWWSYRKSGHLI